MDILAEKQNLDRTRTDLGKIEMELYSADLPKTCENFRCLCTGEKGTQDGVNLTLKNNFFHRIIPKFMIQAGDIT